MPEAIDEFQSAAYLALVEAAGTFDPGRNVSFATFARHHIQGALIDLRQELLEREDRNRGRIDREQEVERRSSPGCAAGAVACFATQPVGAELEATDTVESWIRRLPRLHARALRHIYVDGHDPG